MRTFWFPSIALLTVGVSAAVAQWAPPRIAITYIEGSVDIDGQSSPKLDRVLPENSLVRTAKGRARLRFGRGDTLFLGEYSSMRVRRNADTVSDEPEILTGSAVVITGGLGPSVACVQGVQLSDAAFFGSMFIRRQARLSANSRSTMARLPRKCRASSGC
jgi:hypothetical protein